MKYRLTEKIGSGGMAEVFRATGVGPDGFERPFVIKRIHPRLSEAPEFVRMFVHEAKISARLIHPNIVQVFELAYQDGAHYMIMEPVEGMDMGWLLKRRRERPHESLSPAFVAEVGRQVCRGLDYAHTLTTVEGEPLRIVHRDVTPPNIMVAWNGTVKVLDFGIARAAEAIRPSLTDPGMVKGKMSYVAPELLEGKTADARSDLFSLGAVMHELLTGRQLFSGQNDLETLNQVKEKQIPPPSAFNPGVKPALDGVVLRALSRDPDKRYASAGEMGDELEELSLRKNYSQRVLGDKARDLAQEEGETAAAGTIARAVAPAAAAAAEAPGCGAADCRSRGLVDDRRRVAPACETAGSARGGDWRAGAAAIGGAVGRGRGAVCGGGRPLRRGAPRLGRRAHGSGNAAASLPTRRDRAGGARFGPAGCDRGRRQRRATPGRDAAAAEPAARTDDDGGRASQVRLRPAAVQGHPAPGQGRRGAAGGAPAAGAADATQGGQGEAREQAAAPAVGSSTGSRPHRAASGGDPVGRKVSTPTAFGRARGSAPPRRAHRDPAPPRRDDPDEPALTVTGAVGCPGKPSPSSARRTARRRTHRRPRLRGSAG